MFSITPDGDNINFLISGTCYEIHTGTAEMDDRVAEIQAIEGQWFVKSNDNNIMVADVEYMPLARNSRQVEFSSGYTHAAWEFPHHHRAPAVINGNVSLLYQSSNSRCYGTCLYGDYLFTLDRDSQAIRRIDTTNGTVLSASCPTTQFSFSVVDATHVVYIVGTQYFYMLDMETEDSSYVGAIPPYATNYYCPHWAVIKDVLCVGQVREWNFYTPSPSWTKRQYNNYMFNIWTGEQLFGKMTLQSNADAYIYEYCMDVVVNRDFFYVIQKTSENGGTWPGVVGPEPSMLWRLRTAQEVYGGGSSGPSFGSSVYDATYVPLYFDTSSYGDLNIDDLAYNPFNEMLYFVGDYWDGGSPANHYSVVGMVSPENLSYSIIYSHLVPTSPTSQGDALWLIPARNELYVMVHNGGFNGATIYNVRDWSPVAVVPYYSELLNAPFPDNRANVVDANNRLWYMGGNAINGDPTYLYALNLTTGAIEISIDTGIAEAWGDQYLYPTDYQYRQVIPSSNSILIFKHNTYQYAYQGRPLITDVSTQIYKVT